MGSGLTSLHMTTVDPQKEDGLKFEYGFVYVFGETALYGGAPLGLSPGRVALSLCLSSSFLASIRALVFAS